MPSTNPNSPKPIHAPVRALAGGLLLDSTGRVVGRGSTPDDAEQIAEALNADGCSVFEARKRQTEKHGAAIRVLRGDSSVLYHARGHAVRAYQSEPSAMTLASLIRLLTKHWTSEAKQDAEAIAEELFRAFGPFELRDVRESGLFEAAHAIIRQDAATNG